MGNGHAKKGCTKEGGNKRKETYEVQRESGKTTSERTSNLDNSPIDAVDCSNSTAGMYVNKIAMEQVEVLRKENQAKDENLAIKNKEIAKLKAQNDQFNHVVDSLNQRIRDLEFKLELQAGIPEVPSLKCKKEGRSGEALEQGAEDTPLTKHPKDAQ